MNILVALDLSDASSRILAAARQCAGQFGAHLWLVHVAAPEPDFVGYEPGPKNVRHDVASTFRAEHRELQQAARDLADEGVKATSLLVQGPTAETLLDEAEKLPADIIVIGSHGHGAVHHLLLGSVSEAVLRQAECPILVIPVHERRRHAEHPLSGPSDGPGPAS